MTTTQPHPATLLFIATLLVHFIDVFFGRMGGRNNFFVGATIFIFFALIAFYAAGANILGKENKRDCLIVSLIAFAVPYITYGILQLFPAIPTHIIGSAVMLLPIWPIYLSFAHGEKVGGIKWIGWGLFILVLVLFLLAYQKQIVAAVAEVGFPEAATIEPGTVLKETFAGAWIGLKGLYNATVSYKTQKQQELQALGFYEGQVDSKSKEQLGVYFGELKSLKQEYASGEFIDIFTTLSAQTLDKPLDISLSCEGPGGAKGEITPESQLHVEMFDQPSIDCMIKQGFAVNKGASESKTITLSADFKFSTMSYLRSYFMELEKLRTLRRMSIEPLSQYGITDRNPKAVSTSGPVLIGMSLSESLPIGIDSKGRQLLTLGITLSNKWTGKLKNITKIVLVLPKGIVLDSILPVNKFTAGDCLEIEGCDAKAQNVYVINGISLPFEEASYTTIRALLKVESPGSLLGVAPLSIKSIWAIADYDYTLQKAKTITVRG